jgi:lysozyme
MTIAGIDVSNFQGAFDWAPWRGKIGFAFAKATEGLGFTDPDFAHNWAGIKAQGITRGAYHFAHPANSPAAEARFYLDTVRAQGLHPGDLVMLDLEVTDGLPPGFVAAYARSWAAAVHSGTGAQPVIYTDRFMAGGGHCAGLGGCPLFLAVPGGGNVPLPIGPWKAISFEQTGTRGVPPVDADIFFGGTGPLAALSIGGADMPITSADAQKVWTVDGVIANPNGNPANKFWTGAEMLEDINQRVRALQVAVAAVFGQDDPAALAKAILAGLSPAAIASAVAAAVGPEVAQEVVAALAAQLGK